jgi:TetR/AcrR family transcriptional repressor of mexJK operon
MNGRRGRPTQAEAVRLDENLRDAAVATFAEFGYDGTTMEAIARAAGITKRTLYARYPDKRSLFVDVIPWALSRVERREDATDDATGDDLEAALMAIGRNAIASATDPEIVRLHRIAMNESARFPEFAISADTLSWSPILRVVMDLLEQHRAAAAIEIDDLELASEHFLAMVLALPTRLADFGVFRTKTQSERHLQHAVQLFLRGVLPRAAQR